MASQLMDIQRDFDAPTSIPQTCRALEVIPRRMLWTRALMRACTPRYRSLVGFASYSWGVSWVVHELSTAGSWVFYSYKNQ